MSHHMHNTPGQKPSHQGQQTALRLSRNPDRAMQEMMETIDRVRHVYERETEILRKADIQGFMALQDEKFEAAQDYQSGVEQMLNRKDEMRSVNPLLRKKMEVMQQDFADMTQQNLEALERMKRTMDRLSEKVQFVAKEEVKQQRAFSYGESGHVQHNDRKAISTGIIETA